MICARICQFFNLVLLSFSACSVLPANISQQMITFDIIGSNPNFRAFFLLDSLSRKPAIPITFSLYIWLAPYLYWAGIDMVFCLCWCICQEFSFVIDSMCLIRKVIFIQLQEFPTPSYCRCCSVTKRSDSSIAEALNALKMHFETLHNEIKCVLSITESYSIEKNGSKFSYLLTVRAEVADPPHPPLQSAWP